MEFFSISLLGRMILRGIFWAFDFILDIVDQLGELFARPRGIAPSPHLELVVKDVSDKRTPCGEFEHQVELE